MLYREQKALEQESRLKAWTEELSAKDCALKQKAQVLDGREQKALAKEQSVLLQEQRVLAEKAELNERIQDMVNREYSLKQHR